MPRCQRTFYRLRNGRSEAGSGIMRWTCPYCPDAETYSTVRDQDLLDYLERARSYCIAAFGPPHDPARRVVLLEGLRPECVYDTDEKQYDIYLQRGSDAFQLRLQIGHEMFHRVCSQGRIFHWTHEMLAGLTSLNLLRRIGMTDYAESVEREWRDEANLMTVPEMFTADLWTPPYPPGLYGRAYVTGHALIDAVGWDHLRPLARCLTPCDEPDIARWLHSLDAEKRARANAVLCGLDTGRNIKVE